MMVDRCHHSVIEKQRSLSKTIYFFDHHCPHHKILGEETFYYKKKKKQDARVKTMILHRCYQSII